MKAKLGMGQICEEIITKGLTWQTWACSTKAVIKINDKFYCKQHAKLHVKMRGC